MQRKSVYKFDFASYLRLHKAPRDLLMFTPGSSETLTHPHFSDTGTFSDVHVHEVYIDTAIARD